MFVEGKLGSCVASAAVADAAGPPDSKHCGHADNRDKTLKKVPGSGLASTPHRDCFAQTSRLKLCITAGQAAQASAAQAV